MSKEPVFQPDRDSTESNYYKVTEKWRKDFLKWDHEAICRKLKITDYDEGSIRLPYFGILHSVDRKTGAVSCLGEPWHEPGFDEIMAVYNLFYYSEEGAENSGEWVHFRDVRNAGVFEDAFERQVLRPFAEAFAGKTEAFAQAGRKLGYLPLDYGDAAFQVPAFPGIPIRVIFWDGDDEFPASVTILYDKNIIHFIHPENVVMLGSECMRLFCRAAFEAEKQDVISN